VDEGSEFKGEFKKYCDEQKIHLIVFSPQTGSKRRLGIVERFNRTFRRLLEKESHMNGKQTLKNLIPNALDLYNRYLNHRSIASFFRRDLKKYQNWQKRVKLEGSKKFVKWTQPHFFPAMMMLPGIEQEYIQYMQRQTSAVEEYYSNKTKQLTPGSKVRYYKRNDDPFSKSRGSTLSQPEELVGRHVYGQSQNQGASYELQNTRQRYLPYELELQK
jgi:hypothetical protein